MIRGWKVGIRNFRVCLIGPVWVQVPWSFWLLLLLVVLGWPSASFLVTFLQHYGWVDGLSLLGDIFARNFAKLLG